MRAAFAGLVFLLALPSCQTADSTVITLCGGYALSLSTLADLRVAGKLSASVIAAVDKERGALNPICMTPTLPTKLDPPTLTAAMASADALSNIIAGATK